MQNSTLPVVVIGAGPVGLAAAAHLVNRGETPLVLEAGATVGDSIRQWRHVQMFSPWQFNIDAVSRAMLEKTGWKVPNLSHLPTGGEIIDDYLEPLANLPQLKPHIRFNTRVIAVSRKGFDKMKTPGRENMPFVVYAEKRKEDTLKVEEIIFEAKAVIDASGTWKNPNPLGANGLLAIGEKRLVKNIFYGIPNVSGKQRRRYTGKNILVVGSGHSAINALLELETLYDQDAKTTITWAIRKTNVERAYGGQENDMLPARGALGTRLRRMVESGKIAVVSGFKLQQLRATEAGKITAIGETLNGDKAIENIDEIIATTGARPDLSIASELRIALDPAVESTPEMAPLIDPNIHSCGSVPPHGEKELRHPEKNYYIVGMKSYGRAPTFLLATGYEQVRSVVASLVGDREAAEKVELVLPETGVCSSDVIEESCCGSPEAVAETPTSEAVLAEAASTACCSNGSATTETEPAAPCCNSTAKAQYLEGEIPQSACCG